MALQNRHFVVVLLILMISSCKKSNSDLEKTLGQMNVNFQTASIYDSLKNIESPRYQKWLRTEDSLAEGYFLNSTVYYSYLDSLSKFESGFVEQNRMITISETGTYFYVRFDAENRGDKIYVREKFNSEPELIFDCKKYNLSEVTYVSVSYDSRILGIGFQNENGFSSDIIFLDVENKKLLDDKITNINPNFGGLEWLPNSSGFVYLYFPIIDKTKDGFKKNSFSTLHLLGKNNNPKPIFGNSDEVRIAPELYPKVKISSSQDNYVVGYVASVNDFYEGYISSIKDLTSESIEWKPFFSSNDSVYYNQGMVRGSEYYFRQSKNGKTQLAKVDILSPDFGNPFIIERSSPNKEIQRFEVTKKSLYYSTSKFGSNIQLYKIDENSNSTEIELPFTPGYLNFFGASVANEFIGIGIDGWTSNYRRFIIYQKNNLIPENVRKQEDFSEYNEFKVQQTMTISHDTEPVPLTVIYQDELRKTSDQNVLMYVYGAYGDNIEPYFEPMLLEWVKRGNILAFAHVRGGGEKGKDWHLEGMKTKKSNSWKDLIACAGYFIENNISRKGNISVFTSSAGGITAAMAVNERPELFSSLIADVPRLNPFDLESDEALNSTSYLEYGSVKNSLERKGLIAMDPFLNIRSGKDYPATYISASYKDDRIPIWDNSKYIQKLRDSSLAKNRPILFDIDFESTHASQNSPYSIYYARLFTFAEENMRLDDF